MENVLNIVTFLEEFWITGTEFLSELFNVTNFGFTNVQFLHFFTAANLTLFLGVAIVKWIVT